MQTPSNLKYIAVACALLFTSGLGLYFWQFHGKLSSQTSFGAFGDYINPFLTLISLILLFYISIIANNISIKTNELTHNFNKIQLQPLLFLSKKEFEVLNIHDNQQDWIIYNGYDAPAINILIRICLDEKGDNFTKWINCFSLGRDMEKRLHWIRWAERIEIIWTDITISNYFSITYTNWIGTLDTNISKEYYNNALEKARTNKFTENDIAAVNDIISTSFLTNRLQNSSFATSKEEYKSYLMRLGLLK